MWSPQTNPSEPNSSFFHDPPRPTSPSIVKYSTWKYNLKPPSSVDMISTLHPQVIYTAPFESEKVKKQIQNRSIYKGLKNGTWEWSRIPPLSNSILQDLKKQELPSSNHKFASQIQGPTPINSHGFLLSPVHAKSVDKYHLRLLSVEIFCESCPEKQPDPVKDAVDCIFYTIFDQDANEIGNGIRPGYNFLFLSVYFLILNRLIAGMISIQDGLDIRKAGLHGYLLDSAKDETHLFLLLLKLIKKWDPDILVGYELDRSSWGYLSERASVLNIDLCASLSRIHDVNAQSSFKNEENGYSSRKQTSLSTTGRLFINIWRLMRKEINLTSYTLENMVFHILHQRYYFLFNKISF